MFVGVGSNINVSMGRNHATLCFGWNSSSLFLEAMFKTAQTLERVNTARHCRNTTCVCTVLNIEQCYTLQHTLQHTVGTAECCYEAVD